MLDVEYEYGEYLSTPHWLDIRRQRLEIDGYQCTMCHTAKNLNVHHVTYERLWNEDVYTDLITLCDSCHKRIHRYESNVREMRDMFNAFSKGIADNGKNMAAGAFFWFAWPKFTMNGGYVNPLDINALKALRDEWCEKFGVDSQVISVKKVQDFASRFTKLRVYEMLSDGMNDREIAERLGVSENSVAKRRKDLMR